MVRVYVTINTILFDSELEKAKRLIDELYQIGVDAILVQDMGILKMDIAKIALHASTQTDIRTVEKVRFLRDNGFSRVVLARELSLKEIEEIHNEVPDVELEAFVHGALCVSYSGLCNASQETFSRSSNRGVCAQFCRLKFDLQDSLGNVIVKQKHLLSLKDMCRINRLEDLIKSGVTSFKIEGRLKDEDYVKNVTSAYSRELNKIIASNPGLYHRSSLGKCSYTFSADLSKTFNRGYTEYFLDGKKEDVSFIDTPKAIGKCIGKVERIKSSSFIINSKETLSNGDGLCFINSKNFLEGFRVNKIVGNEVFLLKMPKTLNKGDILYRNSDQAIHKILSKKSAIRKIPLSITFKETIDGFLLEALISGLSKVSVFKKMEKVEALSQQTDNIKAQLSRFGNTPYEVKDISVDLGGKEYFIPSSELSKLRRELIKELSSYIKNSLKTPIKIKKKETTIAKTWEEGLSFLYNISNSLSKEFYKERNLETFLPAYELQKPKEKLLMQTKHCILYTLGYCKKYHSKTLKAQFPLYLKLSSRRLYLLEFDCKTCQMNVYG